MSLLSLAGRTYLVTGVLTTESIAWHVAAALQREGAETVLTSYGRAARVTRKVADLLPAPAEVLELDATRDESFAALADRLEGDRGRLDGVVHSIAGVAPQALGTGFSATSAAVAADGFRLSAYSLQQLAVATAPLLEKAPGGGAVVGLTVDSARVIPGYGWMGVYKAALEAVCRYLAVDLGPSGIRVNLVAAGPVETVSARGVPSFAGLAEHYERWAPLGWDRADPARVAGAALFLLSDLSRYTTGQIVHADGGMHALLGGVDPVPPGPDATSDTDLPRGGNRAPRRQGDG